MRDDLGPDPGGAETELERGGGNSGPSSTTATAGTTPPVVGARSLAISVSSESEANRRSQKAVSGNVSGSIASTVTSSGWSPTLPYR